MTTHETALRQCTGCRGTGTAVAIQGYGHIPCPECDGIGRQRRCECCEEWIPDDDRESRCYACRLVAGILDARGEANDAEAVARQRNMILAYLDGVK